MGSRSCTRRIVSTMAAWFFWSREATDVHHEAALGRPPKLLSHAPSIDLLLEGGGIGAVVDDVGVTSGPPATGKHAVEGAA